MSDQSDNTQNLLEQFGLSQGESSIYLFLLKEGTKSALELSRGLRIGRTKVYRLLESLASKNLVNEKLDEVGKKFEASSIDKLEMLLKEKEAELEKLKESKEKILKKLSFFEGKRDKKSKILYYSGHEGLKQITWNSLKAKGVIYVFEMGQSMNPFTGKRFAEKVREEFYLRKIITKQLTNFEKIEPYTNVEQYVKHYWEVRYIDPKELSLDFELVIYNDIVAIYTYKENECFGVEIHNKDLVRMQKQIFEYMWEKAKKMKVEKGGKAEVI